MRGWCTVWLGVVAVAGSAGPADAHTMPICRGDGDPECGWGLFVAGNPPPPPPAPPVSPPPLELESWTSGEGSMPWAPSASMGASGLAAPDFTAPGFAVGVGVRRFLRFDPNPWSRSVGLAFATLGLSALPRGSMLGNELGLDLTSRVSWVGADEHVIETALRPVLRVQVAGSHVSLPSVLGTLIPAFGFVGFATEENGPHAAIEERYAGLLLRWGFGVRWNVIDAPVIVFAELEPTVALIVPPEREPTAIFGVTLQMGFTPVER